MMIMPMLATSGITGIIVSIIFLILLVISSALVSGSEVAFFSLSNSDLEELDDDSDKSSKVILELMKRPKKLLATILISNNFVNIAIVIVSSYLIDQLLSKEDLESWGQAIIGTGFSFISAETWANFLNIMITVVGVTFLLVLFGEIAPKIYANLNKMSFSKMMARPLKVLGIIFSPLSRILVGWTNRLESRVNNSESYQSTTSKEDLDTAIELSVNSDEEGSEDQVDILKSIVKFGDVSAKQIMKARVDIISLDIKDDFEEVINVIRTSGYSRIPVCDGDLDNIRGLLYAKDMIGNLYEDKSYNWQEHIRESILYIPESKKIDDLLKEFQKERKHMGIVVNEFGECDGLVTLEDIMEEVVGDIKDEFDDEEEVEYIKLGDGNYIFEGKTLLNDVCRIAELDNSYFDEIRGEADSFAGLVLEVIGAMPKVDKEIEYKDAIIKVVSVSSRRIEKINLRVK